jgi:hypothetical protein
LQGAVFTRDLGAALRFSEDFEVGPLWINEVTRFRRDPFERLLHNRADGHFPTSARSGCDRHVPEAWDHPWSLRPPWRLAPRLNVFRYFIGVFGTDAALGRNFLGPAHTCGFNVARNARRAAKVAYRIAVSYASNVRRAAPLTILKIKRAAGWLFGAASCKLSLPSQLMRGGCRPVLQHLTTA